MRVRGSPGHREASAASTTFLLVLSTQDVLGLYVCPLMAIHPEGLEEAETPRDWQTCPRPHS